MAHVQQIDWDRYWLERNKKKLERAKERIVRTRKVGRQSTRDYLRDKKLKIIEHFGGKCQMCGGVFHQAAYDLHHVDPKKKEYNINTVPTRELDKELTKCMLLCANCHRTYHATCADT